MIMGKIIELNTDLRNLIAAGEVIENMASVVKELVENSIDANSQMISVNLKEAGLTEIKVVDDGEGMTKEDMKMAVKRHATSKIKTKHDLFHIGTLGFRGEALPSIVSVSIFELISTTDKSGYRLLLKNGRIIEEGTHAPTQGTSIKVKNLFYNTPARLKHLRSTNVELSKIVKYMNKIALSHPEIRFTLINDEKTLLNTPGTKNYLKVLSSIYSLDIIKSMEKFSGKNAYFKIEGYFAKPFFNRSSNKHITLIANNRMIYNKSLIKAIQDSFSTYLPIRKKPIVLLKITVDPLMIDVNIHPQKLEVKFTEERSLKSLIKQVIQEKLKTLDVIPKITQEKNKPPKNESLDLSNTPHKNNSNETYDKPNQSEETPPNNHYVKETFDMPMTTTTSKKEESSFYSHPKLPYLDYIGQFHGTYLLFQTDEKLYLLDQHAAAERIRYERYLKKLKQTNINTHTLLLPMHLDLSNEEILLLKDHLDVFKPLGLTLEVDTNNSFKITEVPNWFLKNHEETFSEEMINFFLEGKDLNVEGVLNHLAKNLACKRSIKANKYINKSEIDTVLSNLNACDNPYTCPHGRPTIISFSTTEIEKMFERIQS
ncbi:MAG: DNA mismatch repair endonuclease MutL [Candidatus Izimaplasma sp.]|nr:DNA mismatch repair endonuclease MutL [Candidatus Izimaplasma bacterium]